MPRNRHIDIYFDEVHKGGSTLRAQESMINALIDKGYVIDIFVMVTATYAKPTIAYANIIDDNPPVIINWSYEDQQNMKQVSNESIREQIKNSRDEEQRCIMDKLFLEYEHLYNDQYLQILEEDYSISPELVILRGVKHGQDIDISRDFKLKCTAIAETKEEYEDKYAIFERPAQVENIIHNIGHYDDGQDGAIFLPQDTIFGKLKYELKYDIDRPHTQLWFLPYQNLYVDPQRCKDERAPFMKQIKKEILVKRMTKIHQDYRI